MVTAAQGGVDRRHLQADDAAADHEQPARYVADVQRAGGVDHSWVVMGDKGQLDRFRARRDDGGVEGDESCRPVIRTRFHRVCPDEPSDTAYGTDVALPCEPGQAARQPADDAVLPATEGVDVDTRRAE